MKKSNKKSAIIELTKKQVGSVSGGYLLDCLYYDPTPPPGPISGL